MLRFGRVTLRVAALGAAAAIAACSSAPRDAGDAGPDVFVPDPCKASLEAGVTPTVLVGLGQLSFTAVTKDQMVNWELGPQGGHHVWVAVEQQGLRQRGTVTTIDIDDLDAPTGTTRLLHSPLVYDYAPVGNEVCSLVGLRMQLDAPGVPEMLSTMVGHRMRITATLVDTDGATGSASAEITVNGTF